jgi:hypothetical protein
MNQQTSFLVQPEGSAIAKRVGRDYPDLHSVFLPGGNVPIRKWMDTDETRRFLMPGTKAKFRRVDESRFH